MALREEMLRQGEWLFRWRGILPAALVALLYLGFRDVRQAEPAEAHFVDSWLHVAALAVSVLGLVIRAYTVGTVPKRTSGRGTRQQKAERLNTTGAYSVVRHPLYLGNFFYFLGFSLILGLAWFSLVYALVFWIYYERIFLVEEEFLRDRFGDEYHAWADRTPAFLPRLRNFVRASEPFSWRMVLRRETSPWLGVATGLFLVESLLDYYQRREIDFDPVWMVAIGLTAAAYVAVKVTKKTTSWLDSRELARSSAVAE